MFEKEAIKYYVDNLEGKLEVNNESRLEEQFEDTFVRGAICGYNKANEWHYVKDGDLPKKELEEKQLLIRVRNYTEDYIFAYYMLDKYYSKNGKRFYSDTDCDYPIDLDDIIAWKEIVLSELRQSNS